MKKLQDKKSYIGCSLNSNPLSTKPGLHFLHGNGLNQAEVNLRRCFLMTADVFNNLMASGTDFQCHIDPLFPRPLHLF